MHGGKGFNVVAHCTPSLAHKNSACWVIKLYICTIYFFVLHGLMNWDHIMELMIFLEGTKEGGDRWRTKKVWGCVKSFHNIIFPLVDIWTRFIVGHALFICSKERMAIKNIGGPHVEQRCSNRCHFFPLYNHAVFVYLLGGKQKGLWPRALN